MFFWSRMCTLLYLSAPLGYNATFSYEIKSSCLFPTIQVSKLVASEILRQPTVIARAAAIEKWAAVADICRCIHNYNSVLEITSALMNSSVYRLKKVWDKVNKQVSVASLPIIVKP